MGVESDDDTSEASESDLDIDRLKGLKLVSSQLKLHNKGQERSQLREVKNKETQSQKLCAEIKEQGAPVHALKRANLETSVAIPLNNGEINSTKGFKTTGIQADQRRKLVLDLQLACSVDFQILFSFMHTSTPLQEKDNQASEKVSHFYSSFTKFSCGLVSLETLVDQLRDLCQAENAVLIHASLRVLHMLLEGICGVEKPFETRMLSSTESQGNTDNVQPDWDAIWCPLFALMRQITSGRTEEDVKLEAMSIMNIIVTRADAYTERKIFASDEVFVSISFLLKKEAGLHLRKEATHLLYLLLNCPTLYDSFDCEENLFVSDAFGRIFEGLADCLTSPRKTLADMELGRNVIMILALIALSGNSGYELLSSDKLPQDTNFLLLIIRLLAAEIDSESTESHPNAEIFKARTLLMRDILVLLNKLLLSGSSSSSTILFELTKNRDIANLTIDVATRLYQRNNMFGQQFESTVQTVRYSEIPDLARSFKKCLFGSLDDSKSSPRPESVLGKSSPRPESSTKRKRKRKGSKKKGTKKRGSEE